MFPLPSFSIVESTFKASHREHAFYRIEILIYQKMHSSDRESFENPSNNNFFNDATKEEHSPE
jgi:hypothetical protein